MLFYNKQKTNKKQKTKNKKQIAKNDNNTNIIGNNKRIHNK